MATDIETGLVCWLKLQDDAGTTTDILDSSSANQSGFDIFGSGIDFVDDPLAKGGRCLKRTLSGDYLLGPSIGIPTSGTAPQQFTINFWMRAESSPSATIYVVNDNNGTNQTYTSAFVTGNNNWNYFIGNDNPGNYAIVGNDDTWHMWTYIYDLDPSPDKVHIWKNTTYITSRSVAPSSTSFKNNPFRLFQRSGLNQAGIVSLCHVRCYANRRLATTSDPDNNIQALYDWEEPSATKSTTKLSLGIAI